MSVSDWSRVESATAPDVTMSDPSVSASAQLVVVERLLGSNNSVLFDQLYTFNRTLWNNLHKYVVNRAVDDEAFAALVATYTVLIVAGATGSGLVCLVVARKPQMRTARNVFIVNLAISDLLLCLFTMPFTLTEILLTAWPLGLFMCKMVSPLQATSIFVSTISITAIALDRYNVIVYPTREWSRQRAGGVAVLSAIWLVAFLLALPLLVFRRLDHHDLGLPQLEYVEYCYEKWPGEHGRAFYSVASMIFQYVLPIAIVSVAYARICRKLQHRMSTQLRLGCGGGQARAETDQRRMRKTNTLLISIALIFVVSWLPLNIFNLVTDLDDTFTYNSNARVAFAVCHMMGMSSACSNPLLYGWLNDNFRKEFKEVFSGCYSFFARLLSPFLSRSDTSPVPLVLYTKRGSATNHDHYVTSRNGFDEMTTVVTQISNAANSTV